MGVRADSPWNAPEPELGLVLNAGGPPAGRSEEVEQTLRVVTDLFTDPNVPDAVAMRAGSALYRLFC